MPPGKQRRFIGRDARQPAFGVASMALLFWLSIAGSLPLRGQEAGPQLNYPVLSTLVKNALVALNHANLTGNYTVLRDLASEGLRQRTTAADLANIFADHRRKRYDLSPILGVDPQFTTPPAEISPGRLRLVGFFPTKPMAVHFAVVYERSVEGWGIDEISVAMAPVETLFPTTPSTPTPAVATAQGPPTLPPLSRQ